MPGSQPERWERLGFVSANEGEHVVRFADMTPVGEHARSTRPAARVRSLIVCGGHDEHEAGRPGQIWLGDVRLVRD